MMNTEKKSIMKMARRRELHGSLLIEARSRIQQKPILQDG